METPQTVPEFFPLSPSRNPICSELVLQLLWQLADVCEEHLWNQHFHPEEHNCPCIFCSHIGGLLYNVRMAESALESAVHVFPAMLRRMADRARESGDEQRAAELEAKAAEKEANAGPIPTPPLPEVPPHVVLLNQLRDSLEADAPLTVTRGPS
jgi:hypothetical protein